MAKIISFPPSEEEQVKAEILAKAHETLTKTDRWLLVAQLPDEDLDQVNSVESYNDVFYVGFGEYSIEECLGVLTIAQTILVKMSLMGEVYE